MSDYIRMLSYIYSYENGRKKRNVGFAKMDGRNGVVRLFVSIRSGYRNDLRILSLYFYKKEEGGEVIPVEVGRFRLVNGAGELKTQMRADDVEHSVGMYLVTCDDGGQEMLEYASCFQDTDMGISFFREKLTSPNDTGDEMPIIETESISGEQSDRKEEVLFPEFWEQLSRKYPKCKVLGKDYECIKIKALDIEMLPEEFWKLGNNSFLLHAYYFYRHLLLARRIEENTYYIGVPGYYQKNEQIAAAMFGFQDFIKSKEKGPEGVGFGYWLTKIQ